MLEVDVLGSCVCRDMFRHHDENYYNINRCFSNIPLSIITSDVMPIPREFIEQFPGSEYEKRMLLLQSSRQTLRLLKESNAEYLVIDLADELMNQFVLEDTVKRNIAEIPAREDWYDWMYKKLRKSGNRKSPLELDIQEYEQAYQELAKELIQTEENPRGYEEKKIIVIESYYVKSIMRNNGILYSHGEEWRIKECNEFLKNLYTVFYKYVQNCTIINLPEFTQTSQNHLRGEHPLHYREDTYYYFINALNSICKGAKVNTLENLFHEQSLKNKLEARVANANIIYNLQERITKLEKATKK